MIDTIFSLLPESFPWKSRIIWLDTIDSTNDRAKRLAAQGAENGTALIAGQQTGGRGRLGRSFLSPQGQGLYLSVILRPGCKPEDLMHLTCAAAVAACDAVEKAAGFRPRIKWTNDLVWNGKKLGGILTELSVCPKSGLVDYAVVGIGINCLQKAEDFPSELQDIASSLSAVSKREVLPAALAAAMLCSLEDLYKKLLAKKLELMAIYRKDCITIGREIVLVTPTQKQYGTALSLDDNGGLKVAFADGEIRTVTAGEVSIRGMYGYL